MSVREASKPVFVIFAEIAQRLDALRREGETDEELWERVLGRLIDKSIIQGEQQSSPSVGVLNVLP